MRAMHPTIRHPRHFPARRPPRTGAQAAQPLPGTLPESEDVATGRAVCAEENASGSARAPRAPRVRQPATCRGRSLGSGQALPQHSREFDPSGPRRLAGRAGASLPATCGPRAPRHYRTDGRSTQCDCTALLLYNLTDCLDAAMAQRSCRFPMPQGRNSRALRRAIHTQMATEGNHALPDDGRRTSIPAP